MQITSSWLTQPLSATSRTSNSPAGGSAVTPNAASTADFPPLPSWASLDVADATAEFAAQLRQAFQSSGIRVPPEPILGTDATGKVVVANEHPDKARIENLFTEQRELRDRFVALSGAASVQRAVEDYTGFTSRYAQLQGDVDAQSALVQARIARNSAPFFLRIGAEGVEPFFGMTRTAV